MLLFFLLILQVSALVSSEECIDHFKELPFRNVSLPWKERVEDLVSRLSIEEIVAQLSSGGTSPGAGPAPAIPRLGIGQWSWNTECIHGVGMAGKATAFPHSIGLAATFNRSLIFSTAEATSKEARAKYVNNTIHHEYGNAKGISCFSPVVNIMRHPLWGRNQETYGEDPYLSGQMGAYFVKGLQGNHPRYIRANAGCKHFDAHNGPEDIPVSRFSFDARVSEREWRLDFLPAFHGCIVEGGSLSVMCSYNRLNGVPACAHKQLLTEILRGEWKFDGYVISDQDALENIVNKHKWKSTYEEAAAAALLAGTNLGLSTRNPRSVFTFLPLALQKKLVETRDIAEAVKPLLFVRMRLGEFDPPSMNPYSNYPLSIVQSPEHQELAIEAAEQSFVLLKNKDNFLPLKDNHFSDIAVVGPMADNGPQLHGSYGPTYDSAYTVTPLKALQSLADNVHYAQGCNDPVCKEYNSDEVKHAVGQTGNKFIVVCLGTGTGVEDEGRDRADLKFPGHQEQLLKDVVSSSGNVPVIVLLFNAGPLQLNAEIFNSVAVIFECFFPAQATGHALMRILLKDGPNSNPAGRLPFTWPVSLDQVPEMVDYSMTNRTYRYWNQSSPLFPFGYGLSYTKFEYKNLLVHKSNLKIGEDAKFEVTIQNTGRFDGDEVPQAYLSWISPVEPMPFLQLVAFDKIHINVGETRKWEATINAEQMATYIDRVGFKMEPGVIELYVGGQQPHQSVHLDSNVLQTQLNIHQ